MSLSSRISARRGTASPESTVPPVSTRALCGEPDSTGVPCFLAPHDPNVTLHRNENHTWGYRNESNDSWLPEWRKRLTARDMTFADR